MRRPDTIERFCSKIDASGDCFRGGIRDMLAAAFRTLMDEPK